MEQSKVIIRLIISGRKMYVTNLQRSSLGFKISKNPFNDDQIAKFDLEEALKILPDIQRFYPNKIVQIVDMTGRTVNDVGDIIKEEVQKFIYEAAPAKTDELKFIEPINATFHNYESFSSDYDAKIGAAKIIVHWRPVFWINQSGIHKFSIDIDGVEGIYVLNLHDKQSDELMQQTQKNIAETPWKFQVVEVNLQLGGNLYVMEVEFDFKNNLCTVTF
jgi:hypothetical protein